MKKTAKKLNLNRETLRALQEDILSAANGGNTDSSCVFSCDPVTVRICPSTRCTGC